MTTPTLRPATRERLRRLVIRAADSDGLITRRDLAFIDRHRGQIGSEDPALLRHLDSRRAV